MAVVRAQKISSSQSTASASGFSYDVFLSFIGEDTRKTFTDHLYTALVNAGFRTFRDDPELERGENIKQKLEKAIQQSRSSVIVFSKDYTSSRWCLDELVVIIERKSTSDHVVLPIFYDVDPSQLRKQTGSVAKAFARHQNTQSLNKVRRWRAALREVADLAGMVLQNEADEHEAKFIQNIVKVIQDKLGRRVPLSVVQEKLQKKLLDVNRVLDDAEGKQLNNPTVKDWLNDLKEVVYDAEDLLQEIKTEALRQKMEPESPGSSTSTVQELVSSPPSHAFDSALIISKAEKVLQRLEDTVKQKQTSLGLEASAGHKVSQTIPSTCLVEESGVYGRDKEKEAFIKLVLSDDEKISVIPIVGMGGIGKTTLAKLLYNDVRVEQHFDLQAWACISKEFDVLRISQLIYESLTSNVCHIVNLNLLQSKLKEALAGRKFFFVLDDIWNKNYNRWELLWSPFEFGAHGSKIIVTTRNADVASMMSTLQTQPHCLMPISEEDGWLLFEKHAFKSRGVSAHSHLEEIGRQIVRKCKGLPLAVKSLGGLLCSKLTVGEWKSILNSEMWELPQEESDILPSLWLSYMYLPPHLKRCFAYCSIFPKNYIFKTSELVFLWMAEDLLQPQQNKTAEEIGKDYFNDLISKSFFQLSSSDFLQSFIMHDLINDLASFISRKFCFRWEDSDSPNNLSKTRHFSYPIKYDDDDDDDEKFEALQQAKCLRTFLALHAFWFGSPKLVGKGLYELLPKLQCLRMLKLSTYDIEELPDSVNNLKHLRHLDLSMTSIKKLPDTICTLYNLQALLLSGCYNLTELPPNFGRLINLTHVDVGGTKLIKMPPHMGNLEDLQVLTKFVLDKHTAGDNLLELKKLQNLRGTLHISGLVHGSSLVAYILTDKKFLNELVLFWGDKHVGEERNALQEREVLEKLQPHLNLERLTIDGYGGKLFPGWSRYYSSSAIGYLKLYNCVNCVFLPPLGQLPSLRELHIYGLDGVVSIGHEFYYSDDTTFANKPFRSLRSLRIEFMSGWEEWSHVGDDHNVGSFFPNLRELHLSYCPNLIGRLALDSFPMLKKVVSKKIGGEMFPGWSRYSSSSALVFLELTNCVNCISLPPLGQLPSLRELHISKLHGVVSIGHEFYYNDDNTFANKPFRSLQYLIFDEMSGLQEWSHVGDDHNEGCFFPNLLELHLLDCTNLSGRLALDNFPTLKLVRLWKTGFSHITSSQECPKLDSLELSFCPNFVSFLDGGLHAPNLTKIQIRICGKLGSWPEQMHTLLPSLESLSVSFCPKLDSFPEGGLPAQLISLNIQRCKKFNASSWQNLNKGLRRLTSLERLELDFDGCEEVDSFPEETLLPRTLIYLNIYRLNIMTMDTAKWFGHLNSLEALEFTSCSALQCLPDTGLLASLITLKIISCSALQCLPDTGLPASLRFLYIRECPLLARRCKREKGEDWPKIAHIGDIEIYDMDSRGT